MLQAATLERTIPSPKRILIVDDYTPTRRLIGDALRQAGDYEISEAEDGGEALRQCGERPFDLVISDVMMPRVGGMELLHQLRIGSPDTAVIMITAQPAVELTVSAMKKGAVDFLKKPFDIDDLLYKVQLCFHEKTLREEIGTKPHGAGATLDAGSHELSVQGFIYDSFENIEGDNEHVFKKIVDLSLKVVDGEECALLLLDGEAGTFYPKIVRSPQRDGYARRTIPALQGIFRQVADEKRALMIHSSEHPEIAPSLICAPLMIRSNLFGILCIRKKTHRERFTARDLHYIVSLTRRASLNLENRVLYESVYNSVMDTFGSLMASIQMRDHYTEEHCTRVTKLAVRIAEGMRCSDKEIESLKISAMLHDVGKIAIPDRVLLKPDKMTASDFRILRTHTEVGDRILRPISLFDEERSVILHHHERWDGRGYPGGLAGPAIPFLSRVLAVADSFDAMTNDRPYRPAMEVGAALEELRRNRSVQFDGQVVEACLELPL